MYDMVLSSGYLAFGRQCGFLDAVERLGLPVDAVCGTSSGALAGSMWAAGHSATEIARELGGQRPIAALWPHYAPWQGLFAIESLVERLRGLLPARFEDLPKPLGIGVMLLDGTPVLRTSGPLPEAVAASCAIPRLFTPVNIDGVWYADGGIVDRTAIEAWRRFRGERATFVHLVDRSRGSAAPPKLDGLPVVHSPASKAGLLGLGDFEGERALTLGNALEVLGGLAGQARSAG